MSRMCRTIQSFASSFASPTGQSDSSSGSLRRSHETVVEQMKIVTTALNTMQSWINSKHSMLSHLLTPFRNLDYWVCTHAGQSAGWFHWWNIIEFRCRMKDDLIVWLLTNAQRKIYSSRVHCQVLVSGESRSKLESFWILLCRHIAGSHPRYSCKWHDESTNVWQQARLLRQNTRACLRQQAR